MPVRLSTPFGTIKIKRRWALRHHEQSHKVPVVQVGALFFIWQPKSFNPRAPRT